MARISLDDLTRLTALALRGGGAGETMAQSTARALVSADAQGLASHGVSRAPLYHAHLKNARVNGSGRPRIVREKGAAALIDADYGLAYPAVELAIAEGIRRARAFGVALLAITNSNHPGAIGLHLAELAEAGLVGLMLTNSPAAMPAWGGRTPLFGTNPIAAAFPRRETAPLVIDLSLSEVARGKLMVAARNNESIPLGWAYDRDGHPTTDPKAGLEGSMAPMGGVKGSMLALLVELLCCALTGANFGFEADSFFNETGNRARLGQFLLVIDPAALGGEAVFFERIETLIDTMLADEGVRLPGNRRQANEAHARQKGVEIPDALLQQLRDLAGGGTGAEACE